MIICLVQDTSSWIISLYECCKKCLFVNQGNVWIISIEVVLFLHYRDVFCGIFRVYARNNHHSENFNNILLSIIQTYILWQIIVWILVFFRIREWSKNYRKRRKKMCFIVDFRDIHIFCGHRHQNRDSNCSRTQVMAQYVLRISRWQPFRKWAQTGSPSQHIFVCAFDVREGNPIRLMD